MKIYGIIDKIPFTFWTIGWSILFLDKYINCEVVYIDYEELKRGEIATHEDADFLFFEIGNPQHAGWSATQLKHHFPNARLIAFCSDTIYYQVNGLQPQLSSHLIDLHFEIMPQSIDWLKDNGAPLVERWIWTTSDLLVKKTESFNTQKENITRGEYDFIGVYHPGTISNPDCWRHHAVKHLTDNGYTFTQGGGTGHEDNDLNRLFEHYAKSWTTLGTSSHNRPELTRLGCCKGFRDVLGPLLGSILIYDDHPNILSSFTCLLPTYEYDRLDSIIEVHQTLMDNSWASCQVLQDQIKWTKENTIDKQIVRALLKHNFISKEDLR